jgi:3-methylcrotonyl-CoA carboxylase alpha subunit
MRTCREMGIITVAVYSEPDADALHVRTADEALPLGGVSSLQSYLNTEKMVEAVRRSGADAVHPGYGFLAENAAFARAVETAGAVWIGPPPRTIELMGDKIRAKEAAVAAGVPVVPGYDGSDPNHLAREAERIGYPVMLKAAAGGGGKGMRAVHHPEELPDALDGARREARASFGDDRVFLEKLLVRPRHVEIQVIADTQGAVLYLGERDCSVQRRHQKVVEEAPSPAVTPELRRRMGEAAAQLARNAGYVSAGTVEFLVHGSEFYFLEMNTRIQVEHPVTEMVTGLDLVRLQLQIAAGEQFELTQEQVTLSGHAIEVRLYAEEPNRGFLPSTGTLRRFVPPSGPGVRNDVGVTRGSVVTPFYDPMLAKLIVHGATRAEATTRLAHALHDYQVVGVGTNLAFLRWLVRTPALLSGEVDIEFLDRAWRPEEALPLDALALGAAWLSGRAQTQGAADPWRARSGWRHCGMDRHIRFLHGTDPVDVTLEYARDGWQIRLGETTVSVTVLSLDDAGIAATVDGRRTEAAVRIDGELLSITLDGGLYDLPLYLPGAGSPGGGRAAAGSLTAPMPGVVVKVHVAAGESVAAHQPLMVLEAMKMEHVIEAPQVGKIAEILFAQGDMVAGGATVVRMEEE